ncbi:hypothetical protein [Streptomyces canus]|uniref:hypothetical protein n=1 Tax=Streptomyces canus TaxID=58343 RepID=UPI000379FB9D|nr:hypothetical protein [Streptomyces canus]
MPSISDEVSMFRLWRRTSDSAEWLPTSRLLVHVGDGGSVVPAHLSWVTEDGAQSAMGFSPDMATCYGHRRTTAGDVVEVRGERDDRRVYPEGADGALGYEFDTEVEDAGGWYPAGRLKMLIDDGSEAPVRWVAWGDQTGNTCSFALRSVSPSGNADVSDLVSAVWASAEHRDAGEVAKNLVDASTSKWFAPHNRASLEFRLTQEIAVDRYVLTAANDAPDRDPATWTLRGSADGHLWRTLDIRSGQSFAERHQSRMYRIAEPGSYGHYRLDITGNNGSPHLQLQAVRFRAYGSGGFVGYRQRPGHAPVAYRGIRVAQASPDMPAEPLPEDAPAPSKARRATSTRGFPPNTLDAEGTPIWLSELASDEPHHTLHVVRGLEPAQALEALGANPQLFQPCELPRAKPDRWSSLPGAALGIQPGTSAALLAGRIGAWTFVYDDSAFTGHDDTTSLSANGRVAATSTYSSHGDADFTYAVDGTQLAWINVYDLNLKDDLSGMPDELRAAFEAAGTVEHDYLEPGEPDDDVCMRAICALASLSCTVEDLRRIPLLATPFG